MVALEVESWGVAFPKSQAPSGGGRLVGTHGELSHCTQQDCFYSGYP